LSELSEALDRREWGNLGHRVLASFFGSACWDGRLRPDHQRQPGGGQGGPAAHHRRSLPHAPVGCDERVWVQSVTRLTENLEALLTTKPPERAGRTPAGARGHRHVGRSRSSGVRRDGSFAVDTPAGPVKVQGGSTASTWLSTTTPVLRPDRLQDQRGIGKASCWRGRMCNCRCTPWRRDIWKRATPTPSSCGLQPPGAARRVVGMMRRKLAPR